jgi:signal transduction histidine kinase
MAEHMWRVVAVFRTITLIYAAALIIRDHQAYAHPAGGFAALIVMTCWTGLTIIAYSRSSRRRLWLVADVAVAVALVLSTRWVETAASINAGAPTLPVSWAAASVLACAVAGGPWTGLAGGLAISAADVATRHALLAQNTFNGIVLVLIAGGVGGYVVRIGLRAEAAVDRVARREAAINERERIARGIHDSVLQVLSLVSSRGSALGGEAAELGQLAQEQEAALRSLVSSDGSEQDLGPGLLDVRALIERHGGARVTVSCPATAVLLAAEPARALGGAAAEALDNVRRHAGPRARAWVLVEDAGCEVRVSVRDDGLGFERDRLARAAEAGRLGVSHAIVGRLRQVGGRACLTSAPGQGTEVELCVPRR